MRLQQLHDVADANDKATFDQRLIDIAGRAGFDICTGMLVRENFEGRGRHFVRAFGNIPAGYAATSCSTNNTERCPVLRRLKQQSTPFFYDQRLYVKEKAMDMWEEQAPFGFHCGIAAAIHMGSGRHFVLGFDRFGSLPRSPDRLGRMLADLQLLATFAESATERIWGSMLGEGTVSPSISRREREVLQWTLSGKTAWEAGTILCISERTVVHHIVNAMRKLGAVNKHQAALKALQLNLL